MPMKRDSVPNAAEDYPTVLKQFAEFVSNLKTLNIPSLSITDNSDDPSRVPFTFLGDRFILRTRMGIDDTGRGIAHIECLKADDNGHYLLARKCFISIDSTLLFHQQANTYLVYPIKKEASKGIFNELVSSVLVEDTPRHQGFFRTVAPK
jgi:hypothetical protein